MSQPDEHDRRPSGEDRSPASGGSDAAVFPTRTGGWMPARPASAPPPAPVTEPPPPSPPPSAAPPDRSTGPAKWAPQLAPIAPLHSPVPTTTASPASTVEPASVVPQPPATSAPGAAVPADPAPVDDDPDRLRPDELPWGVPARALVGADGQLPPPTLVARHRSPAAIAGIVALAAILATVVALATIVLTR